MKRFFSSPIVPLLAGLCLRLFFVLNFPATSGDTVLYEQMATNWLQHGVYAMNVAGSIQPVDLRMPGYPAYLVLIDWFTGKTGAAAHFAVMLGQVAVDLATCVVISLSAIFLLAMANQQRRAGRAGIIALWLAALCPFTANYVAVPLTEVFAVFFTAAATVSLLPLLQVSFGRIALVSDEKSVRLPAFLLKHMLSIPALASGVLVGVGTLFRPETPILLGAALLTLALIASEKKEFAAWFRLAFLCCFFCLLPLLPWVIRNSVTLHEFQLLSPKNSNLPGELVPYGFMAWEKTWLFRMKDCYLAPWKLNEESIDVDSLPARAFDSPEEKQRVAQILEPYNTDLSLTAEEDAAFAEIARERTHRHPLRTYFILPALRAIILWFTPRIELLPVSGHVFPLAQMWEDDKVDQAVTSGLFLLNFFYVGIAVWGARKLWRCGKVARYAVIFFLLFILLRTAFLTTLETPEPRYTLECFPALITLGAVALSARRRDPAGNVQ